VWLEYLTMFEVGVLFLVLALRRFRRIAAASIG
jgi:hypothetical protein